MDQQTFTVFTETESKSLKVKDWVNGLTGSSASDALATLDAFVGGSFGAFGKTVEKMIRGWTEHEEDAVLQYYETYASAPSKKLKKRQDCEVGLLEKKCRIEAGVVDHPVDHDKMYLTTMFYNEDWDEVGNWAEYLGVNENSGGIGNLDPLISATVQDSTGSDFPYDVAFEYDDQRFSFLSDCSLMSDSNLGQGQTMESRRCEFDCRG